MQLRYFKNLQPAVDGMQKISALAWSQNTMRLAIATADRTVHLFDENGEHKDKFPTKPGERGQKSYIVKAMAFSPDSQKIAIAQTDSIIYVYRLGDTWGDTKKICGKFQQNSSVTCMVWPKQHAQEIFFGLAEGKIRVGQLKSNKSQSLYQSESYCLSIAASLDGQNLISGHLDGTIYKYNIETTQAVRLTIHSCPPVSLSWGLQIVAAGNDSRITFYDQEGQAFQRFDYSNDNKVKEFSSAIFNSSGEALALANFNRFYVFVYNSRRQQWDEGCLKHIENYYSVTAMVWKPDGSKLITGSLCGSVDMFDVCLKKALFKGKFEITYVSQSQVIVKNLNSGQRISVKSEEGGEISKVNIYQDRYLVAHTPTTLLLGDMDSCNLSEISWHTNTKEKLDFSNPGVCMVFAAGELTLVEYGNNEILGTCRTEHLSAQMISARLCYKRSQPIKTIAYLLDVQTICVQDLSTKINTATINHDSKIDFLELNPSGTKLLFRDKRRQLHLYNIPKQTRVTLLNFCNYAQWVPDSDVVVAQNRQQLCVWYNINDTDKMTLYSIKGDVEEIERSQGKTEVIVTEGSSTVSYQLEEPLIQFGFALENQNLEQAAQILEPLDLGPECEANWRALQTLALEQQNFIIAEQCSAVLGDVSKARYLRKVKKLAEEHQKNTGMDGRSNFLVQAKLAALEKHFGKSKAILLAQNEVDEAMDMFQELHRFDEAILIAEQRNHEDVKEMKDNYFEWLLSTGQEGKAGELKEREGEYQSAINLYLKGGLPAKAAAVINNHNFMANESIMEKISEALQQNGMYEKAGEFYEKMEVFDKALKAYEAGHAYKKAVNLSKKYFPSHVVNLEEQWGEYLVTQKQYEAAINHFREAGQAQKAIEAAISARQWSEAIKLVASQPSEVSKPFYRLIAKHFGDIRHFEQAEQYYIKAGAQNEAFDMYTRAGKWEQAFQFASNHMKEADVTLLYVRQAQKLEQEGKYTEAERMYMTVNQPNEAIKMYKQAQLFEQMLRLVAKVKPDKLRDYHLELAKVYEQQGQIREAEQHYIDAGIWQKAVDLYKNTNQWEEAIRVAKNHGTAKEIAQVAKKWSETQKGQQGNQMLIKMGLYEAAMEYELELKNFQAAFQLVDQYFKHKMPDVHLRYALYLEDEQRYKEAEENFIKAGKPGEAISMYEHIQDFHSALNVAKQYEPQTVPQLLINQGTQFANRNDFQKAEQCFIQAKKIDLAIEMYKRARMWQEAIRVAQKHAPHKVKEINEEYSRMKVVGDSLEEIVQSAKISEQSGD